MRERFISRKLLEDALENPTKIASDIQGDVVIDYDKKSKIARINLYNFSFDNFRENQKAPKLFSKNSEVQLATR